MANYLAIIPARGGSKGVPGKNTKLLAGKPLIAWSIEQALDTPNISKVVVSTDCEYIAEVAKKYGADVPFLRPANLATDQCATEPVLIHAIEWYLQQKNVFDAIILLQPTSPLRHSGRIDQAIKVFESEGADSLLSVCESHAFFWKNIKEPSASYDYHHRPRRQDIKQEDRQYKENGSIYVTTTKLLLQTKNRLGGKISLLQMDEDESWEIDSITDFHIISTLMELQQKNDH